MAKNKKSGFFTDFKKFITKGNIIDMAVGVVVGSSFSAIVNGLVKMVINPCIALIPGADSMDEWKTILKPEIVDEATGTVTQAEVAILWGTWLQTIIDFLIVAFCIFVVLRVIMKAQKIMDAKKIAEAEAKAKEEEEKEEAAKEAADAAAAALAEKQAALDASVLAQEKLLCEIRDLLKNK